MDISRLSVWDLMASSGEVADDRKQTNTPPFTPAFNIYDNPQWLWFVPAGLL